VEGKEQESVMMRDDVWLQVAVEVQGLEENLWPRSVVRAVSTVPCCVGLSFSVRSLSHRPENQDVYVWVDYTSVTQKGKEGTTCSVFFVIGSVATFPGGNTGRKVLESGSGQVIDRHRRYRHRMPYSGPGGPE
jgi:hypothetical protein